MGVFPWGWIDCKDLFPPFGCLGQHSMSLIPWWFGTCRWVESTFSPETWLAQYNWKLWVVSSREISCASLQEFSLLLAMVTALIFSHKFYQCFHFHQKCLLSLSLDLWWVTRLPNIQQEGVSIHPDELGSTFLPSPNTVLIWPQLLLSLSKSYS